MSGSIDCREDSDTARRPTVRGTIFIIVRFAAGSIYGEQAWNKYHILQPCCLDLEDVGGMARWAVSGSRRDMMDRYAAVKPLDAYYR